MKYFAVLFLMIVPGLALCLSFVDGNQSGTWSSANSPYTVVGDIVIPSGQTLNIEPGVEVKFLNHYKITVYGDIQAIGAENDSIRFTTDSPAVGWGGIGISSPVISRFSYCRLEFGKSTGNYPNNHGGAVALFGSDAVFSNTVFADNEAVGNSTGMGGAIYASGTGSPSETMTSFTDCRFLRNHCYGEGGAVKFTGDYNTEFLRCEFRENTCDYGGGAISGYGATGTRMINCLFVDNYTMFANGGAVHTLGIGNLLFFTNCTFTNNTAVTGDGGAVYLTNALAYFVNTIVYLNNGMFSDDVYVGMTSYADIYFCNMPMPDGGSGANNINANPQFVDAAGGDFRLVETSTSVDAGTDFFLIDGYTLVDLAPNEYCGTTPDMGAYEFCSMSDVGDQSLNVFKMGPNYPNPFSTSTAINYTLPADSFVSARVFNVRGHEVRTLINTNQSAGANFVSWNGRNNDGQRMSEGVYFLRLQAGDLVSSVRMVLTN